MKEKPAPLPKVKNLNRNITYQYVHCRYPFLLTVQALIERGVKRYKAEELASETEGCLRVRLNKCLRILKLK